MRLKRGDQPKNQLDAFCLQHDLTYDNKNEEQGNKNPEQANKKRADADLVLEKQASLLARTKGTSLRERSEARLVHLAMAAKRKLGGGRKKRKHKSRFLQVPRFDGTGRRRKGKKGGLSCR